MEIIFDGCIEILLNEIMKSSIEAHSYAVNLLQQLPDFQKTCVDTGLCPKGELIRSMVCRNFLRDAVLRMRKKLILVNEDTVIKSIVETTNEFIEAFGEETEAERAYIVVRNLIIVAENIAKQTKRQIFPIGAKQSVQMLDYHIDLIGIKEFEDAIGFTWEKNMANLLKPKLPPMTAKQNCETRYRHMFFNLLVRLITIKETGKESNDK